MINGSHLSGTKLQVLIYVPLIVTIKFIRCINFGQMLNFVQTKNCIGFTKSFTNNVFPIDHLTQVLLIFTKVLTFKILFSFKVTVKK